jgi:hypothetical protein
MFVIGLSKTFNGPASIAIGTWWHSYIDSHNPDNSIMADDTIIISDCDCLWIFFWQALMEMAT